MVKRSTEILPKMERVLTICEENLSRNVRNAYDFELFKGLAKLFRHTANTYLVLSELEKTIQKASGLHFDNNQAAFDQLNDAIKIIEDNIAERYQVFGEVKATWEKSQFPKGMSAADKKYVHGRDQQRNFANRRADLSFMICDEEGLGLEDYLSSLKAYTAQYKLKYLVP
jgi:hypothetical protein